MEQLPIAYEMINNQHNFGDESTISDVAALIDPKDRRKQLPKRYLPNDDNVVPQKYVYICQFLVFQKLDQFSKN